MNSKGTQSATEIPEGAEVDFEAAMRAVREEDTEGFAELHQAFFNLVMATAYRVLNDRHDAEDIAQEVFTTLWKKAKLYDPTRGKPGVWLATMARNRAIDRLRSKQRRSRLHDDLENEVPAEMRQGRAVDVFTQVRDQEESQMLRGAVMKLNPEQREAIEMTFFNGLSQSQAAEVLGTPLGTIKARVRRGILRLRTMVPEMMA